MTSQKTVIIIAGPTAAGKTALAIRLAKYYGTEIISADSRQCFRELKIGVARPSEEQLASVKHWFIASHSIHERVTAATFESYALEKATRIFENKDVVVMVGGTGLYLRAFTDGLHEIPQVPEHIMDDIVQQYYEYGMTWLQKEIETLDPQYMHRGEIKNPQRMMRALGVIRSTGKSIMDYRENNRTERPFSIKKYALAIEKEKLKENIDSRVEQMLSDGLVEEARKLLQWQHLNALQTVGYKEMFQYLRGECSLAEAIALIRVHTRQYAKRQMTWFRNAGGFEWIDHSFQP